MVRQRAVSALADLLNSPQAGLALAAGSTLTTIAQEDIPAVASVAPQALEEQARRHPEERPHRAAEEQARGEAEEQASIDAELIALAREDAEEKRRREGKEQASPTAAGESPHHVPIEPSVDLEARPAALRERVDEHERLLKRDSSNTIRTLSVSGPTLV